MQTKISVNGAEFEFVEISARNGCETFWMAVTHTTEAQWCAVMGGKLVNGARFPKVNVSLNDCEAFCDKLNELTGGEFRLPTEFEYCAALGKEPENLADYAVFDVDAITEVGTNLPNEFGLYDIRGLAWHHCALEEKRNGKPRKWHALRGGSWLHNPSSARAVYRYLSLPALRYYGLGFRVVCCRPPSGLATDGALAPTMEE